MLRKTTIEVRMCNECTSKLMTERTHGVRNVRGGKVIRILVRRRKVMTGAEGKEGGGGGGGTMRTLLED